MAARAQYAAGHSGGEDVPGYLQEEGVPADSITETYAALRLEVDNWRWAGVPFYLRAGKRLARKVTEIAVTLKPVPHLAFSQDGSLGVQPNQLILTVQPNEGVTLQLGAKIPGTRMSIRPVNMEFLYGTSFLSQSPEAYERLIMDAMRGDPTLFTRNDEVEAQWRICDPIVSTWAQTPGPSGPVRGGVAGTGGGRGDPPRGQLLAGDLRMATASIDDAVWSERGTTPDAIESALRELLGERSKANQHAENGGLVPARVLNMVVFVESEHSGEIADRLRGVGRYHASRTVVLSYESDRKELNARVSVASEGDRGPGELALLRETAIVEIGERHLDDLTTIVDPLVVSDLPTLLWSPHRHPAVADALLELAQATLIDSIEEPVWSAAIERACALSEQAYVVDLAWLRSTPWRERVAATFDPPRMRPELDSLQRLEIRHHPDSTVAAMLFAGWLASRLGWQLTRSRIEGDTGHDGALSAGARTQAGARIELRLQAAPELRVPGLAGVRAARRVGPADRPGSRGGGSARAPP